MSFDLFTGQETIKAYLAANLPFLVASGGVEEAETLSNTQGILDPHVVLRFGSPQPSQADQSFAGARFDGEYATVDAMCVGATDTEARGLASKVSKVLMGYRPDANSSELRRDWGGGTFTVIAEGSRPQFYIAWLSFRFDTNLYDVGA